MSAIATSIRLPSLPGKSTSNEATTSSRATLSLRADNPEDYQALARPQPQTSLRFAEWYKEYQSLVRSVVRKTFTNPSKAEDVCAETWIRIMKAEPNYDPQRSKETTFIKMIARAHVIDSLRRDAVRAGVRGSGVKFDIADQRAAPHGLRINSAEQLQRLQEQVSKLPELQRDVIRFAYIQGMSLREIATTLSIPLGTVKSALSRALAKLREGNLSEAA